MQAPLSICGTSVLAAAAGPSARPARCDFASRRRGIARPLSLYFSSWRDPANEHSPLRPPRSCTRQTTCGGVAGGVQRQDFGPQRPRDVWTAQLAGSILKKSRCAHAQTRTRRAWRRAEAAEHPILTLSEPTIEGLTKHLKAGYPSAGPLIRRRPVHRRTRHVGSMPRGDRRPRSTRCG